MFYHYIELLQRQVNDCINEIFNINIFCRDQLPHFERGFQRRADQILQLRISILTLKINYFQSKIKFYENYNKLNIIPIINKT